MPRRQMAGPRGTARRDDHGRWLCLGCGERLEVDRFYVCGGYPRRMCKRCDNLRAYRQRKERSWATASR